MSVTFFSSSPADPVWGEHKLLTVKAVVSRHRETSELLAVAAPAQRGVQKNTSNGFFFFPLPNLFSKVYVGRKDGGQACVACFP